MTGREECEAFKLMCLRIADANDIEYFTKECSSKKECYGICEKLRDESRYFDAELTRLAREGEYIHVTGVAYEAILEFLDAVEIQKDFDSTENYTDDQKEILCTPLSNLDLPVRTLACLRRAGIYTIEDLTRCTREEIVHIKQFGEKTLRIVTEKLHSLGLYYRDEQLAINLSAKSVQEREEVLDSVPIEDLGVSPKCKDCLLCAGIKTVGSLMRHTPSALMEIQNIRPKYYKQIVEKLDNLGLSLKE